MSLDSLMQQRRSTIVRRWFDSILDTYPADTAKFLKKQKDPFANPVGSAIAQGVEGLFDQLLEGGVEREKVSDFLDNIIRIRAIQEFTPSQAVSFVFMLKKVVREETASEGLAEELAMFEARVDELALLAFDIYTGCRERLFEVRLNEVKNRTTRLLKRANLIYELSEPDAPHDNADPREAR